MGGGGHCLRRFAGTPSRILKTDQAEDLRFGPTWSEERRLADGTKVRLRLLRREDRQWLLAGFERLSPESRYLRFFAATPRLPESVLRRLLDTDGWNHLAIAAEAEADGEAVAEGVGVARMIRLKDAPDTAEAAVTVVDHMQRRGLGKLLLSRLAAAARERGITRFRAEVLRTNTPMKALLRDLDETARPVRDDGSVAVYELVLPEPVTEEMLGPLFDLLKLAGAGVEVLLRWLPGGAARAPRKRRKVKPPRTTPDGSTSETS